MQPPSQLDNIYLNPTGQKDPSASSVNATQLTSILARNASWLSPHSENAFVQQLPKVRIPMRFKLTFPYVFLAVIIALVGAYVISQVVLDNLQERFLNQLVEVGKLSADRMVVEENTRLETLRLLANVQGLADALSAKDAEQLRTLVLPIAVNNHEDAIEILDQSGKSVLSARHLASQSVEKYAFSRDDNTFAQWTFVQNVLAQRVDQGRDKYAGVVHAPWGDYFYVAGPLRLKDSQVGVILVGTSIDTLAKRFHQDTQAQTTFYDFNGQVIDSSLLRVSDQLPVLNAVQINQVINQGTQGSFIRDLQNASIKYSEIIGPWTIRSGNLQGLIGTAIPQTFLARTSGFSRLEIFLLLCAALFIIITVGVVLARRITRPLLNIVRASARAAQGDLNVSVAASGDDEVALLAFAFNGMMDGLREVTERRLREMDLLKALEQEREMREIKSRFVSMVSHEFRTPLTTILSSSEFIRKYGETTPLEKREKHFDRIQSAVTQMKQLIDDVLVIGKTEAGRLTFRPSRVDIPAFTHNIAEEMQANAPMTHRILFSYRGSVFQAVIDENLLRLAITNLLSNAIKYSPGGGMIRLNLTVQNNAMSFSIADQGLGIPKADQEHLFETFHRSGNVANISGTGLGLYITKMVVDLHHGRISLQSEEGKGTVFTITLPIVQTIGN